jgi:hypothetical protein
VIPEKPEQLKIKEVSLDKLRRSYLKQLRKRGVSSLSGKDIEFLAKELNTNMDNIEEISKEVFLDG